MHGDGFCTGAELEQHAFGPAWRLVRLLLSEKHKPPPTGRSDGSLGLVACNLQGQLRRCYQAPDSTEA